MGKIFLSYFDKWKRPLSISAIIFLLFFSLRSEGLASCLICLVFVYLIASMIFQFTKKRWGAGCLTGLIIVVWMFVWGFVGYVWLMSTYFDSTQYYSKCYTREDIKNITGVEIPEFEVIDSYFQQNYFRDEIRHTIEFKTIPDDNFFSMLDSIICAIPQNDTVYCPNEYWSKDEDDYNFGYPGYRYRYNPDLFDFTITKGSQQAEIVYGKVKSFFPAD